MYSGVCGDAIFSPFNESEAPYEFTTGFTLRLGEEPHPLCLLAASKLQLHLQSQQEWDHNFGLSAKGEGSIIGKMFGVLVVRTKEQELGYLAAFSGKLAGGNYHAGFVPPIFDGMASGGFLNEGMTKLTQINEEISKLELLGHETHQEAIYQLKSLRKSHSTALQKKIFDQYHFLNKAGESKSLVALFENACYKSPPAGAGECAAPKLLQYAFLHKMEPLAMAEFWWGLSPKSATWKHGHFYAPCREKCAPILAHMLN
jgi:tRNA pseudouridine32 synthase/23S rRNA pseudouridine746 synthase